MGYGQVFYQEAPTYYASDDILAEKTKAAEAVTTTPEKLVSIQRMTVINPTATLRTRLSVMIGAAHNGYVQVYKNGVAVGTQRGPLVIGGNPHLFDEDITFTNIQAQDTIELWGWSGSAGDITVNYFRVCGVETRWL
jgi:hypothetical protein